MGKALVYDAVVSGSISGSEIFQLIIITVFEGQVKHCQSQRLKIIGHLAIQSLWTMGPTQRHDAMSLK